MKRLILIFCVVFLLITCEVCSPNVQSTAELKTPDPSASYHETLEPTFTSTALVPSENTDTPASTFIPTSTPTASPTPTPTASPTPTPRPITQARLDSGEFDHFFDDAILIGDSLTEFFSYYIIAGRQTEPDLLGNVKIFGVKGMNIKTACQDVASADRNYLFRGKRVSITELIHACNSKHAFIMLGVNDVADRPWDIVQSHFAQLIDVIHEKCPDTEVVIQGVLPITKQYCDIKGVTITYYNGFNEILSEVCDEHGAEFLDFSKDMMDEKGYLALPLCSDQLFHLNKKGEAIWLNALRLYAACKMFPDAAVALSE